MTGSQHDTRNIRIKLADRALLDRAASLLGKSRANFVLEAARDAAKNVLMDRTVFALDPKAYTDFLVRLDSPSEPDQRLHRSLLTPAPWD